MRIENGESFATRSKKSSQTIEKNLPQEEKLYSFLIHNYITRYLLISLHSLMYAEIDSIFFIIYLSVKHCSLGTSFTCLHLIVRYFL
jgi:hypothetical protein